MKKNMSERLDIFLLDGVFHENLFCFYNKNYEFLDKKVQNDKFPQHKIIKRALKRRDSS